MNHFLVVAGLFLLFFFAACKKETLSILTATDAYFLAIPEGFPKPFIPADNLLTASRVALGRKLFYDPILSSDSTKSCASCHQPQLAFSDHLATSLGVKNRNGTRNAPSLANVAYQTTLLREGGLPTLEMQVLVPIQEHNEFDFNILLAADRLKLQSEYVHLAQIAYDRTPDAFVITRALAAFQRTLISGNSPFDAWFFKQQQQALSDQAQLGFALFNSEKLQCNQCHNGFLFTDQAFANNGLYTHYPDSGRIRLTGIATDRAVFKVPSLRNIAVTAPYMHDGSLPNLEAVLQHYQSGGQPHENKSAFIQPFSLNHVEKAQLIAFLNSLTDQEFLQNSQHWAP